MNDIIFAAEWEEAADAADSIYSNFLSQNLGYETSTSNSTNQWRRGTSGAREGVDGQKVAVPYLHFN